MLIDFSLLNTIYNVSDFEIIYLVAKQKESICHQEKLEN